MILLKNICSKQYNSNGEFPGERMNKSYNNELFYFLVIPDLLTWGVRLINVFSLIVSLYVAITGRSGDEKVKSKKTQ